MGNIVKFEDRFNNFIDAKIRSDSYLTLTAINAMSELEITSIEDIKAYQSSCNLEDTGVIDVDTFNNMIFEAFDTNTAQEILNYLNKTYIITGKDDKKKEKRKKARDEFFALLFIILFFAIYIDGLVDVAIKLFRFISNLIK